MEPQRISVDILIAGAGLSGLALAYFLQKSGFPGKLLVLDREKVFESARQGYSLTLQNRTRSILQEYKLLEEMYQHGSEARTQKFYAADGETLYLHEEQNVKRFNYPLPRQSIRKLTPDTVHWNKNVASIVFSESENVVTCSDGSVYACQLLFACDGIHSKISKAALALSPVHANSHSADSTPSTGPHIGSHLQDFKLMNIYGRANLTNLPADDFNFFSHSEVQVLDGTHRFFCKPFNNENQMWEFTYPLQEDDIASHDIYRKLNNREDPKAEALEIRVAGWKVTHISQLMKRTNAADIIVHPLFDHIPVFEEISHVAKLHTVLVGDSIHPMSPYIGMGANSAIIDCFEFVDLLKKKSADLSLQRNATATIDLIDSYHKSMAERTQKFVKRSRENTLFYHTPDAVNKEKLYKFKNW